MPNAKVIPFSRKKRIMLVEDDHLVREGLAMALSKNGFTVHTAMTAEEALQAIDQTAFDGIICDYHLPGMNGLDFFMQTGSRSIQSVNILITAFGFDQIVNRTTIQGIDAFYEKPFTVQSLISGLNSGKYSACP